jgi:hypothetical protein
MMDVLLPLGDLTGHAPGSYQARECKQKPALIFVLVD